MVRIAGTIFAALAGLAFGSFLNVVVTRWPADESVVQPRSHCRNCGRFLAWWENIPLLSWLALRGRCRTCKAWIGWRYPLVELAVGVCWTLAAWKFPGWPSASNSVAGGMANAVISLVGQLIFFWLLIALAALDAENLWLPDLITLPGIALGFLLVLLKVVFAPTPPFSAVETSMPVLMARAAFGATASIVLAAGLILLIRWIYWLIRRREGIGLGDAKLMAMLAAWLGFFPALLAFGLGAVMGAAVALILLVGFMARSKTEEWAFTQLPLGTFLCIGGIISSLWGHEIIGTYMYLSGIF
jgi:leader peptidase (prepilin peptidase)/N-methyltransferase